MCQGMPTTVLVIVSLCNVLCVRACLPLYLLLLVFVMSYVSGHVPLYLLLLVFVMSYVSGMPTTVLVIVSLCNVLCVRACLPLYLLLLVSVMSYVSGHAYHCTCYC